MRFWQLSYGSPKHLVIPGLGLFLAIVIGWIVVNWVKTAFIFNVADVLDVKRLGNSAISDQVDSDNTIWQKQIKLFRQGRKVLVPVLALSLFTIVAQFIVTFVLSGPWFWGQRVAPLPGMMVLATALFILFMLFFSLLNFFAAIFVVIYQQKFNDAFASAIHFLKAKAKPLFFSCILLLTIYASGILVGLEVVNSIRVLFSEVGPQLDIMNLGREQIIWRHDTIGFLFLLWLGFLNAFFNVGLFVFFKNYVKPVKFESEKAVKSDLTVAPAPSH